MIPADEAARQLLALEQKALDQRLWPEATAAGIRTYLVFDDEFPSWDLMYGIHEGDLSLYRWIPLGSFMSRDISEEEGCIYVSHQNVDMTPDDIELLWDMFGLEEACRMIFAPLLRSRDGSEDGTVIAPADDWINPEGLAWLFNILPKDLRPKVDDPVTSD